MSFQSIASIWFALSLPAIALMYLLKRTYIDTPVASHLLWNRALQVQEANRPWQRLRRSLLLLLQLIVASLLVLALMEPGLWRSATAAGHVVIVVDRSASMTALAAGSEGMSERINRLEAAKAAIRQWIDEHTSASTEISIIATGKEPAIELLHERDKKKAAAALSAIEPFFGTNDNTAALSLADALLREEREREIVVVTDGQWPDAAAAEQLSLQAPVTIVNIDGGKGAASGAIAAFGVKAEAATPGRYAGVVTIRNDSSAKAELRAGIYADGSKTAIAEIKAIVAAGEWESVAVHDLPAAKLYKAQLLGGGDGYMADDVRYQFAAPAGRQQVLLVTAGNLFLEKALQLAGAAIVKADPSSFEPDEKTIAATDWIVIDGAADEQLQSKAWQRLLAEKPVLQFAAAGKAGGTGGTGGTAAAGGNDAGIVVRDHPVTRFLSFEDVHIAQLADPAVSWGEPIIEYRGIPALYAGTVNGRPRLLFTFDLHQSDLPLRPEFPVLMAQAADWMSGGAGGQLGEAVAGAAVELDFASQTAAAEWKLLEPLPGLEAYAQNRTEIALEAKDGLLNAEQTAPEIPGLYQLVEKGQQGEVIAERLLAVTADPREQGISRELQLQQKPAETGGAAEADSSLELQLSDEFIRWLALLALLVIVLEWGVYRRGRAV
ncbi:VWA domain-containing protein [Paenibacillus sp. GCM10027626]|uniref:VWA domain-containing protein n=1 Tax=Paenibacillus sp. GCM10027626 TaxID=3273411 RepID=UPI0036386C4B